MLKFCVEQWDKNKHKLERDIRANIDEYNDGNYMTLVKKVVELIFNEEDSFYGNNYNVNKITEIDNGDYQGTLLYLIPVDTYQPSEYEYLMTNVGYGSCSGCDTLQSIQFYDWYLDDDGDIREIENRNEKFVKNIMDLCLHLVQNTIKPYNGGWRFDDKFEQVSNNN